MITTITALTTTNKEANALNDIQKAMPPKLHNDMLHLDENTSVSYTPLLVFCVIFHASF
ncbi:MAG TPA: hypothetical protein VFD60_02420 [Nitrososphaeraceae archaeon]|jgi:hypothetical protein|nr:hypothetical protein [Nitrososphaeraceae archaeon]